MTVKDTKKISIENVIRLLVGCTLWTISAIMTAGLYLELADSTWQSKTFFVVIAVCLEGTKILLWRSQDRMSRVVGGLLVILSLSASMGETLVSLSESERRGQNIARERLTATPQHQALVADIESCDRQIAEGLSRVSKYPPNYYSLARQDLNGINILREEKAKALKGLQDLESVSLANEEAGSMFSFVARIVHIDEAVIHFFISMVVAVCIEFGAILLTMRDDMHGGRKTPRTKHRMKHPTIGYDEELSESEKQFLLAAQNESTYPFLNGRDKTAKKLGLSYYEGKKIVQGLIVKKVIEVKQRRLVVVQPDRKCSA